MTGAQEAARRVETATPAASSELDRQASTLLVTAILVIARAINVLPDR
jgi:hypothetical protein